MAAQLESDSHLEIGHVLFMDVVGYSKLLIEEQRELQDQLNGVVRGSSQFQAAEAQGKLVRLPTGDGMALVFFDSGESPIRCAVEISRALRDNPKLQLRMGIHTGPVSTVRDVNDRSNIAGAGINVAQRVMDLGDAGHILLSKRGAEDLSQSRQWQPHLHDLGSFQAKHGVKIDIVNYYTDGIGNPRVPEKLAAERDKHGAFRRRKVALAATAATIIIMAFILLSIFAYRRQNSASEAGEKSVAVLPFENLSADASNAFFADGIQDDVLTSLAKISDLKVISRTSVLQYRGAGAARNLRDIARALGVTNILEGTVRRVADRVLVNVQLIDALHDRHIWAERYDRTLTDSIGLQGELATEIAHALRAKLDPQEKARLAARPTNSPEAYVLYLKARELERTAASKEDAFEIDRLYDQAVALDSKFALALARQSMWNGIMYYVGRMPDRKTKAHALATEALRVAPDLPEAHIAMGEWFRLADRNYDAALKELSIAAKAIPNNPELLSTMGALHRRQGRWREALANFHRAQELDPRVPHEDEAQAAALVRDWPTAAALYRHQLDIDPTDVRMKLSFASLLMIGPGDFAGAKALLAQVPYPILDNRGAPSAFGIDIRWQLFMLERDFAGAEKVLVEFPLDEIPPPFVGRKSFLFACTSLAKGDPATARVLFEKARSGYEPTAREHPDEPTFLAPLGLVYAYLGRNEDALRESRRALDLVPEKDAIERPRYSSNLALVYALTGQSEEAVNLVERLLTTPAAEGITLTELRSWKWDGLRSYPRFQKIIAGPEPKTVY
jgi:TolB-like protein/Flp pilus assembly protein TadD